MGHYFSDRGHGKRREKSWDDNVNLRCSDAPGQFVLSEQTGNNRDILTKILMRTIN